MWFYTVCCSSPPLLIVNPVEWAHAAVFVCSSIISHSSCHQIPLHTFPNPSVPFEHTHHFTAQLDIDGSVQSQLGLQSQAKLGVFIEGADSLPEELKVKGHCS